MKMQQIKKDFNRIGLLALAFFALISFGQATSLFGQTLQAGYTNQKQYAKDFKRSNGYFLKGKVSFEKGKMEKAENLMKDCLKIFPAHDEANFYLAIIYYNKKEYASAEKCIEAAHKYFELRVKMWEELHLYHQSKLKEQRSELVSKMNKSQADQRRISELNSAINDSGYKKESLPAKIPYIHGNILLQLKKYKEAHSKYLEALKINPNHDKASNNVANLFYMIKDYKKALHYLDNAEKNGVKVNPKFREAINKGLKK